MKNTIKKITAVAISAILMLSVLTACGETVTLMDFIQESTPGINLDGKIFNFADMKSDEDFHFLDYKINTNLYDSVIQRFSDVEQELNCEISMNSIDYSSEVIVSMLAADAFNYEALYGDHAHLQDMARGGFATPVTDYLDIIDIKNYDKYGTPSVQECNAHKGEIIALSPISWLYKQPTAIELLIFNMDHVDRYGKTNPREFLENGTWNWETFEHVISDYYVNEDENVIYSLTCRPLDLIKLLCLGNGVSFTYKDENGVLKSDFGQPKMLEAIDFYNKIETEYDGRYTAKDSWDYLVESFAELQNSMACLTAAWQLYNDISYDVKNYTVMPFPTGPKGEYGVWPSSVEGMQGFVVLKNCDEPEYAFKVIDLLCEPLPDYETEQSRMEFISENVVYDIEDAEVIMTTHKNGTYSYWKAEVGDFQPDTLWRELSENKRAVSEVVDRYSNNYNRAIEEYMTPNLEIEKYFND